MASSISVYSIHHYSSLQEKSIVHARHHGAPRVRGVSTSLAHEMISWTYGSWDTPSLVHHFLEIAGTMDPWYPPSRGTYSHPPYSSSVKRSIVYAVGHATEHHDACITVSPIAASTSMTISWILVSWYLISRGISTSMRLVEPWIHGILHLWYYYIHHYSSP